MSTPTVICTSPTFGRYEPGVDAEIERAGAVLRRVARDALDDPSTPLDGVVGIIVGTEPVTAAALDRAPDLRIVAKHGAGVDNIDLDAAHARGIVVTNAPGTNAIAVAEHTIGLILAVAREIPRQDAQVRAGAWSISVGTELHGATIGIVGMGSIGRLVAVRARAFGMSVVYSDQAPVPAVDDLQLDARFVTLDELLGRADVVTLHAPLLDDTRHLIGAAELRRMRPSALLVNAARGGMVDEAALLDALEQGVIRGAALDVFEQEPPGAAPLLAHPRLVVTPHIAAYTEASLAATSVVTAGNVAAVLRGEAPPNPVPR